MSRKLFARATPFSPGTSGSASTASSLMASRGLTSWGQDIPYWTPWWTRPRSVTALYWRAALFFVTERTVVNPLVSWPPSGWRSSTGTSPRVPC